MIVSTQIAYEILPNTMKLPLQANTFFIHVNGMDAMESMVEVSLLLLMLISPSRIANSFPVRQPIRMEVDSMQLERI